jgi:ankyrin repeat protein
MSTHGAKADAKELAGNTALMGACFKGYINMVHFLVNHKTDGKYLILQQAY